ncbi:MAG: hypothetical protein ACKOIA_07480 [Acidimicrobiia bacterium]
MGGRAVAVLGRVGASAAVVVGGLGVALGLALVLALGVALGPGLAPAAAAPADACAAPMAETDVRVVVVVDPGDGGPMSTTCLVVPRGTTGMQVLARRAAMLGVAVPRYASSGLLCAIDGYPSSGCGERGGAGFRYWAYFSGTSGDWSYGKGNPFTRRVVDGDIEGWRFVEGAGNGTDPPPRLDPSPSLFPVQSTASSGPTSSAGSSAGSSTGSAAGAAPSGSPSGNVADGVVTGGDAPVSSDAAAGRPVVGDAVSIEVAGAPVVASTSSRPWVPVVIVVLVMVGLAGGAVVRSRTRA